MTLETMVEDSKKRIQDIINYSGDRAQLRKHIKNTLIGGAAILGLNALNAPDVIEVIAYCYTAYNGFKAYRDFQHI